MKTTRLTHRLRLSIALLLSSAILLWGAVGSKIDFTLGTTSGNPASGKVRLWANTTSGNLECLTSSGTSCFPSSNGTNNLCTDQPSPGVWNPTWTTGHTYCLSSGTYTVSTLQTISVNNVSVVGLTPAAIIQRTTTGTSLFSSSGTNFLVRDLTIDGNGGTGTLIVGTGDGLYIDNVTFQNVSTNGGNGLIEVTQGNHIKVVNNRFPSNPDTSVLFQSDTGAITDFHMDKNTADFASTSSRSAFRINQTANNLSDGTVNDNNVVANAGASVVQYCISSEGTSNKRVTFANNSCLANSSSQGGYFFFGFYQSTAKGNKYDLNNNFGVIAFNMGDCYGSSIEGNILKLTAPGTGGSDGIKLLDGTGCDFNSNVITDIRAQAGVAYRIGTSVAATDQITIHGGLIQFVSGGGGSAGAIGILLTCDAAVDCSNDTVEGVTIIGTSNASSTGIAVQRSAGTVSKYAIYDNNIDGMVTAISLPTSATLMTVGPNTISTVTTAVSDSATGSNIVTHTITGSGALSSASPSTLVVTLSGNQVFTTGHFQCNANNQTTQANPIKVTLTSGTSITFTGPNTVTDTVGYTCSGY